MWRALRTEIWYFRPWLLGGFGIAAGIGVLLSVLNVLFGEDGGAPSFVVAILMVIAGMVVSFIAMSYRSEERRARLLLAGPLTPRQLAAILILLPVCFVGLGALAAIPMVALSALITGELDLYEIGGLQLAGIVIQFLGYATLGPLAQESSAARRQLRTSAAVAGWSLFVAVILVLAISQLFLGSAGGNLAQLAAALVSLAAAATLYQARTDFTR